MRALNIASGVAVLFTTLAFGHLLHHHYLNASSADLRSVTYWSAMTAAGIAGVLSLVGGCLLIRRGR